MNRRCFVSMLPVGILSTGCSLQQTLTSPSPTSLSHVVLVPPTNNYKYEIVTNVSLSILDVLTEAGLEPTINIKTQTPGPFVETLKGVKGNWRFDRNGLWFSDNVAAIIISAGDHVGCFLI